MVLQRESGFGAYLERRRRPSPACRHPLPVSDGERGTVANGFANRQLRKKKARIAAARRMWGAAGLDHLDAVAWPQFPGLGRGTGMPILGVGAKELAAAGSVAASLEIVSAGSVAFDLAAATAAAPSP